MTKLLRFGLPRTHYSDPKHSATVVPSWIVSVHDRADGHSSGCDIMLGNGNLITVEDNRVEVEARLEEALKS